METFEALITIMAAVLWCGTVIHIGAISLRSERKAAPKGKWGQRPRHDIRKDV